MSPNNDEKADNLIRGGLLVKNTFLNISSKVIPLLAALVCIPILINTLGKQKFGILTLAWLFIGYFNLFDFGLSRAIVKMVASRIGNTEVSLIKDYIWTGLVLMLGIGMLAMVLLSVLTPFLVESVLEVPTELTEETTTGVFILAISLPFTIMTSGFRGVLQSYQKFKFITLIQLVYGIISYVGLAIFVQFTTDLVYVITYLALVKLLVFCLFIYFTYKKIDFFDFAIRVDKRLVPHLLSFGGWVTVSNILSPIMRMLDRFLIGSLKSMSNVTYYTTSYDLVHKVNVIPQAMAGVLFPAFSTSYNVSREKTITLFKYGLRGTIYIVLPLTVAFILFAEEGLRIWLGAEFARKSSLVLQILAIGAFFNNMAQVPFAFIQSLGRPDLTAKVHMVEFPIYISLLYLFIMLYGIVGAAIITMIRVILDLLILMMISKVIFKYKYSLLYWFIYPTLLFVSSLAIDRYINSTIINISTYLIFGIIYGFLIYNSDIGKHMWYKFEEIYTNYKTK